MAYPVHVQIEYRERASRLSTFFRIPLLIVPAIVGVALNLCALVVVIIAWFAILFTGRYPAGLFRFVTGVLNFDTRLACYGSLLTDRFPPLGLGSRGDGYAVQVWAEPPARLSRLTTLFRLVLLIPARIVQQVLLLFGAVMSFFAWWIILCIGRLPNGAFEVMELPQRYNARFTAYFFLLTDAFPWFQAETEPDPEPWQAPV